MALRARSVSLAATLCLRVSSFLAFSVVGGLGVPAKPGRVARSTRSDLTRCFFSWIGGGTIVPERHVARAFLEPFDLVGVDIHMGFIRPEYLDQRS